MADRPIIFSAPMVRALLREIAAPGTGKTQTRRTHPPEPERQNPVEVTRTGDRHWAYRCGGMNAARVQAFKLPYAVGDRLYVREHWRCSAKHDAVAPRDLTPRSMTIAFEAGGSIANQDSRDDWRPSSASYTGADWMGRFRQAMHMPRWASRLTLIVTDVRVQRLHDCSEADATAEGAFAAIVGGFDADGEPYSDLSYREGYRALWDSLHGPGAWNANPWVAAYTFRPVHVNIDQIHT